MNIALLCLTFGSLISNVNSQELTPILNPEGGQGYSCTYNVSGVYYCKDFSVTPWSSWGQCTGCNGIIMRQRTITDTPKKGSLPKLREEVKCLENQVCETCSYTQWSEWSACSDSCGSGVRYRARSISSNSKCGLSDELFRLREFSMCEGGSSCKCDESLNGLNGLYYRGCQKYTRTGQKCLSWTSLGIYAFDYLATLENSGIGNHTFCRNPVSNNTLVPTIWCYVNKDPLTPQLCDPVPTDCLVSEWSQWSSCSSTCEEGKISRSRTIIQEMQHGGEECPTDLEQIQDCSVDVICPVDCALGSWSYWSSCNVDCGKGNSTRSRNIITRPKGTGAPCGEYSQTRSCDGENCLSFWQKNKYSIIGFSALVISLVTSIIYILIPNRNSI